ncbi:MAG: hypothetical protein ACE15F_10515 [bacterium]
MSAIGMSNAMRMTNTAPAVTPGAGTPESDVVSGYQRIHTFHPSRP